MKLIATHLMAFAIGILGTLAYQAKAQQAPAAAAQADSTVVASTPTVQEASAGSQQTEPSKSPIQAASHSLAEMVAWYRNPSSYKDELKSMPFGNTVCTLYATAEKEQLVPVRNVKVAVADKLQDAFTLKALRQDALHVPEYTALVRLAAEMGKAELCEGVQEERLKDEAAIEALANPSMWQRLKWWWKS